VADTAEIVVFISRAGIYIDADAGKCAGESFGGDTDSI